jgi:hypothetical protein
MATANHIKAIETFYKGYHFRSRLEARWAVFFDTLGIQWKYEDQGFEKDLGGYTTTPEGETYVADIVRYLPDFYLPNQWGGGGIYVEVKGDKDALKKKWWDNAQMHDFGGILPNFQNSYGANSGGLLLLSDIPEASTSKLYLHPILQHHKGIVKSYAFFNGNQVSVVQDSPLADILDVAPVFGLDSEGTNWDIDLKEVSVKKYYPNVEKAYAAARAARFEHGQQGSALRRQA